jgi:hypothetical protein
MAASRFAAIDKDWTPSYLSATLTVSLTAKIRHRSVARPEIRRIVWGIGGMPVAPKNRPGHRGPHLTSRDVLRNLPRNRHRMDFVIIAQSTAPRS